MCATRSREYVRTRALRYSIIVSPQNVGSVYVLMPAADLVVIVTKYSDMTTCQSLIQTDGFGICFIIDIHTFGRKMLLCLAMGWLRR